MAKEMKWLSGVVAGQRQKRCGRAGLQAGGGIDVSGNQLMQGWGQSSQPGGGQTAVGNDCLHCQRGADYLLR